MFKSIKWKIFFGFLVLAFMLFVAGSITIYQFVSLSKTVNSILDNNYKIIQAATSMLEALEREDSGVLLFLSGDRDSGKEQIMSGDSSFYIAMKDARDRIASDSDKLMINKIQENYREYNNLLTGSRIDSVALAKINGYSRNIYPVFTRTKSSIKSLMIHNQYVIYQETTRLRDKSKRAIMPRIVAILSALLMTVIFTYFINKFFVKPLLTLTDKLENYKISNGPIDAGIMTQDELKRLEGAIQDLVYRLKKK